MFTAINSLHSIMRTLLLLLLACCLAGCATHKADEQRRDAALAAANDLPDPSSKLTTNQITQLKTRLDQLHIGMSRAKVLQTLDLPSFNVRYYQDFRSSGVTYNIQRAHMLTLAWNAGDYDATLLWARFDGELWPKNSDEHKQAAPSAQ
jgi:outer membrane protein assembly factor BamE (lipoprotein component of BamABCDE complex)